LVKFVQAGPSLALGCGAHPPAAGEGSAIGTGSKQKACIYWAIGALMATLFLLALKATQYFRFENSDDILLVKAFMGYEGGVPAGFSLYVHTLLARPLQGLSLLFPGVAWFSWLQLALLWLGAAVLCRAITVCSARVIPLPVSFLPAACFLAVFAVFPSCRINYTTTASLAGAAAVAQLLTVPFGEDNRRRILLAALPSIGLLACCYALRWPSALPALAFWLLALWLRGRWPSIWRVLLLAALTFAVLAGGRALEIRLLNQEAYADWNDARTRLMDYHEPAFDLAGEAELESIGWSRAELELVREWYFMDANITAEALHKLADVHQNAEAPGGAWRAAAKNLVDFYTQNPAYGLAMGVLTVLCLCCALPGAFGGERHARRRWAAALALAAALGLQAYLALQGRLLSRAIDTVLFPCAGFLFCLMPGAARFHGLQKPAAALLALLLLAGAGLSAARFLDIRRQLHAKPDTVSPARQAALEAYGLEHPDCLILYGPNLLRDTRLFPDVSQGIPANLMIWGDWYCRTPSWYGQLARFGVDGPSFAAAGFLRDNIRLAVAADAPPQAFLTYLEEGAGSYTCRLADQRGDIRFFEFIAGE